MVHRPVPAPIPVPVPVPARIPVPTLGKTSASGRPDLPPLPMPLTPRCSTPLSVTLCRPPQRKHHPHQDSQNLIPTVRNLSSAPRCLATPTLNVHPHHLHAPPRHSLSLPLLCHAISTLNVHPRHLLAPPRHLLAPRCLSLFLHPHCLAGPTLNTHPPLRPLHSPRTGIAGR